MWGRHTLAHGPHGSRPMALQTWRWPGRCSGRKHAPCCTASFPSLGRPLRRQVRRHSHGTGCRAGCRVLRRTELLPSARRGRAGRGMHAALLPSERRLRPLRVPIEHALAGVQRRRDLRGLHLRRRSMASPRPRALPAAASSASASTASPHVSGPRDPRSEQRVRRASVPELLDGDSHLRLLRSRHRLRRL